ncbi:efflux transporter outer membrane subunit [Variovorax sp. J22P168]|uniref:efflux transporter outer membrane subunit n=1 Tax=Variovorax jilinensis TaxID=3053513 RepID=UPI002574902B|nr:efflux transporter outer membrane subunit [Variovorax sp. J22P168]MDM0015785.1 efflux transporter outer membrane subunit [Variovorax sp. J22P168]
MVRSWRPGTLALALAGVLFLGGCTTVGPDFQRPEVAWLSGWKGGSLETLPEGKSPGVANAQLQSSWWRAFDDRALDRLIAEAQRANPSVQVAGMRIMEARAQLGIVGSALYPQMQQATGDLLNVGQRRAGGPDISTTVLELGGRISWEVDFWGKFRRSIEAADAGYFASIAQYDDIQVLMAAQVAGFYASIRTVEVRLQIARENAALQKRSLDITELLYKSGNDSELDVQQARAQYISTLATIPQLEIVLRQTQNALAMLLARPPGPLPELAAGRQGIPKTELQLIVDLPADLLRRRPDVRAAEIQLAAQSALIGVSVADLYPSISLIGSLGLSATSMSGSPNVSNWAMGPSLVWNVFDHGRLSNTVLLQDARFQQLYAQYQATVLGAAREVDDGAVAFARTREQIALLAEAVKAARRSLEIATLQYREGLTDFQRVLDSQRALFGLQEQLVSARGSLTHSLIAIYKAMGGGWEEARSRPVVDDATREIMGRRSDWKSLLAQPLPAPGTDGFAIEPESPRP